MSLQVDAGRPGRPTRPEQRPKKPRIKLAPDTTNYGTARIKFIAALLAAIGLFSFAASQRNAAPDDHYLEARRMLTSYELGKPQEARNYRHPVYQQTLMELDLVDPESISAPAAGSLASELDELIRQYMDRHSSVKQATVERATQSKKRRSEFVRAQNRTRLSPVTEYPECEEDEK